jgi:hypothetical protein
MLGAFILGRLVATDRANMLNISVLAFLTATSATSTR